MHNYFNLRTMMKQLYKHWQATILINILKWNSEMLWQKAT